jgi:hypothetical protein
MLALSTADPSPFGSVFVWCGVLIVVLLAAFAVYSWFKRWMSQTDETEHVGFTLSDLREMHRQGKMSDQEFEQTKAKMLGSAKQMADKLPEVLPRRLPKAPVDEGRSPPAAS